MRVRAKGRELPPLGGQPPTIGVSEFQFQGVLIRRVPAPRYRLLSIASGPFEFRVAPFALAPLRRRGANRRIVNKYDEYRRNADEAQRWADRAINDLDRAAWLRIAQGWLQLVGSHPKTAEESFDDTAKARGTGQDDSESSH
jgi:hypothetical protein